MVRAVDAGERMPLRDSQEFQSALIRFPLGLAALVFLVAGHLSGQSIVHWLDAFVLYMIHLVVFVGLFVWVLARPAHHRLRSDLSILADLKAITSLIWLSGDPLSPLYLIYILLFISQGTRHGPRNLMVAAVGSIICFTVATTLMAGWSKYPVELSFVLVGLGALPMYHHRLLRNLLCERLGRAVPTLYVGYGGRLVGGPGHPRPWASRGIRRNSGGRSSRHSARRRAETGRRALRRCRRIAHARRGRSSWSTTT